jgi:signal recognition particle subunit SEC65
LADLTDAQQQEILTAVRELRIKVKNIEQFVEPPDDWKVRVHWLATSLSAIRNLDVKGLQEELAELGGKIDELMSRVPDVTQP